MSEMTMSEEYEDTINHLLLQKTAPSPATRRWDSTTATAGRERERGGCGCVAGVIDNVRDADVRDADVRDDDVRDADVRDADVRDADVRE